MTTLSVDPSLPFVEITLESQRDYSTPFSDADLSVKFTGPDGQVRRSAGFWDGGRIWRVRFSPDMPGGWRFETTCSDPSNADLHGQRGDFSVAAYQGDSPLYRHGPITVSDNHRYLIHADSTPFFWLADTAWNGILKANPADWEHYLTARRRQGFTAVQSVLTQWRAFAHDAAGETAFTGRENILINPAFYRRLDAKVAAVARHGLVPALVLLWACTPGDPGHYLPEEDGIRLARYLVARYQAYRPIWMLGGDGDYRADKASRWQRIGQAVFDDPAAQTVTMHPCGVNWVGDVFRGEAWFDFISYQSGHGDSDEHLRWIVEGPPAQSWSAEPTRPIINQEPCYEGHLAYHSRLPFDAAKVRRALYWSLLVSPTAGVTYGHHGTWPWMEAPGVPMDHPNSGLAPTWQEALQSEGSTSVSHLKNFFSALAWWKLRPASWLVEQPGYTEPARFISLSEATDGSFAVAYLPAGDPITLQSTALAHFRKAQWFNPHNGSYHPIDLPDHSSSTFSPPNQADWVLLLEA